MEEIQIHPIQEKTAYEKILDFAQLCHFEKDHSLQVTKMSLRLFDELVPLHGLTLQDRRYLECAAILHDIGWSGGQEGHHKRSRDMIILADQLPFNETERILVGLVARYHRKGLPKEHHKYYDQLSVEDRRRVKYLAALLRIADGLDRSHMSVVEDLTCTILTGRVIISIKADRLPPVEREFGKTKADLFEAIFSREVVLETLS